MKPLPKESCSPAPTNQRPHYLAVLHETPAIAPDRSRTGRVIFAGPGPRRASGPDTTRPQERSS